MANFPALIRGLIANVAAPLVGPMLTGIEISRVTGTTVSGPTYGPFEPDEALVEATNQVVASANGTEKVSVSKFTFFTQRPIREGDRIRLNGVITSVIKVGGLLDETGKPYLPEAWTGK